MLLAVLAVARPVLHGAVGQQAPHAADAADGVDEEHVARGLDQGLVEVHPPVVDAVGRVGGDADRKSTRLNSSHLVISYAVFCLKKKKNNTVVSLFSDQSARNPLVDISCLSFLLSASEIFAAYTSRFFGAVI